MSILVLTSSSSRPDEAYRQLRLARLGRCRPHVACVDGGAPVTRGAALRGAGLYLRRMTNESKFGPVLDSLAKRSFDWVSFNRRKCKESGTWPH